MANTFWLRLRGLLGRTALPPYHALILQPCASVHTCFMKYPIDVIFLSVNGKVIHLQENMVPWRSSPIVRESSTVVELCVGGIRAGKVLPGDILSFHQ